MAFLNGLLPKKLKFSLAESNVTTLADVLRQVRLAWAIGGTYRRKLLSLLNDMFLHLFVPSGVIQMPPLLLSEFSFHSQKNVDSLTFTHQSKMSKANVNKKS